MEKIIIAIDTCHWHEVLNAVLTRPWPVDTSFKIVSVVESQLWQESESGNLKSASEEIIERRRQAVALVLQEARSLLIDSLPGCPVHIDVRIGDPRLEIIKAATEWMADQIIVGAHGSDDNRLFAGSVPRSVMRHALCSVNLVRLNQVGTQKERANICTN